MATIGDPQQAATPVVVPVSFNLPQAEYAVLRQLADTRGVPIEQALREAIVEKKFFTDHRRLGQQVVLKYPDGKLAPINWSY